MLGNKDTARITNFLLIILALVTLALTASVTNAASDRTAVSIIPGLISSKTKPVTTVTTPVPVTTTTNIATTPGITATTKTPIVKPTPTLILSPVTTLTVGTQTIPVTVTTPAPTRTVLPTSTASPTPTFTTTPGSSFTPIPTKPVIILPIITPVTPALSKVEPVSGSINGAVKVNIVGYGFTKASDVLFGETSALSYQVVNDKLITAVSPTHQAGKVTVSVVTPQGISLLENGFTYIGTLSVQMLTPKFIYSGKLNGSWLTLSSYFTVIVNDTSGNKAGWHLNASITKLTAGSKSSELLKHSIEGVEIIAITKVAPNNKLLYPIPLSQNKSSIFSAALNSGAEQTTLRFKTQLRLPADIIVGNYNFTLNLTIEAGP